MQEAVQQPRLFFGKNFHLGEGFLVQEFQRRHPPNVIPCAAARLAHEVYVCDPSPAVAEIIFRNSAIFIITSVFAGPSGIRFISFSE